MRKAEVAILCLDQLVAMLQNLAQAWLACSFEYCSLDQERYTITIIDGAYLAFKDFLGAQGEIIPISKACLHLKDKL